jgi:glycosyltransferase involved in cell wall biosynthesis
MGDMEHNDMISIVLPTHNGSAYIAQSIESCLNQSHGKLELIVVNDASKDDTKEIISSYEDPRILYLENDRNMGLANSLNRGFSGSKGEYLTWTSDDNYYASNALAKMLSALKGSKDIDFVYANYSRIDGNGNLIDRIGVKESLHLLSRNCVGPCFLYTRHVYEKVGDYNPDFVLAEDYEYWMRVIKHFKMKSLENYLYYYRLHGDSLTFKHTSENAASVARKAFEKHVTLRLRIRYHLMMYRNSLLKLLRT